jgi:hypothetical protein
VTRYGVSVQKRFSFRGGTQHFSNQYYYETAKSTDQLAELEALLDEVVAQERAMHSSNVTFVRGRLWSQLGTPAQNQMLVDKALSGTGAASPSTSLDRERAFLVRYRAGVDSRGRPVYLRKWWHLDVTAIAGVGITSQQMQNTAELTSAQRSALETFANSIGQFTSGGDLCELVAKNGREVDGPTQAHRFIEHRQLGDEWRGQ